jgi:uncharacterized protein YjbI with pentapeptide repeats
VNLKGAFLTSSSLDGADLRNANLDKTDLGMTNFFNTNLTDASFIGAGIGRSIFKGSDLTRAKFQLASIGISNIHKSILRDADFRRAKLSESSIHKTDLTGVNFIETDLVDLDLKEVTIGEARIGNTVFGNLNLGNVKGLDEVFHSSPSTIGTNTIQLSMGRIPDIFLRGCGLRDWEIESAKLYSPELNNDAINKILYKIYDLRANHALQISPLFISYSRDDSVFVDKLESHLNIKGIRFWRDVHDLKSGRMETQIDRAIRQNPTVLLILSEHSLKSDWVEHEVRTARGLEKEMERDVLCPIALDDSWRSSPWPKRVMEQVMEYNILDFSTWEDDGKFGSTFNKLIDGLGLFYKG